MSCAANSTSFSRFSVLSSGLKPFFGGVRTPPKKGLSPEESTENLEKLVEFAAQLMREERPDKLFEQLLTAVVDLTGAEKGFVIVLRDGERQLAGAHHLSAQ